MTFYTDEQKIEINKRAKEVLASRHLQEDGFAIWYEQHRDELEAGRLDRLLTRRAQMQTVVHKICVAKDAQGFPEYVLSSEIAPDRMGDVVMVRGIDHRAHDANPVALWSHDAQFVIGSWPHVYVQGNELRGRLKLAPMGISPRVDEIIKLTEAGLVRGVSIGFIPHESEPLPGGGRRFTKSELVEVSLCSTPANAACLAVAKKMHISDATLRMVFDGRNIDDDGPMTAIEVLADEIGAVTGRMEREFNKKLAALSSEIRKLKKAAK